MSPYTLKDLNSMYPLPEIPEVPMVDDTYKQSESPFALDRPTDVSFPVEFMRRPINYSKARFKQQMDAALKEAKKHRPNAIRTASSAATGHEEVGLDTAINTQEVDDAALIMADRKASCLDTNDVGKQSLPPRRPAVSLRPTSSGPFETSPVTPAAVRARKKRHRAGKRSRRAKAKASASAPPAAAAVSPGTGSVVLGQMVKAAFDFLFH